MDFLQGWATALLSGLPGAPVISSGELSASLTSYQLAWHTTSITDIAEYNILYRKLPVCLNTILALLLCFSLYKTLFLLCFSPGQ